jgi:tetratricopeptide (TPR) repeat protein
MKMKKIKAIAVFLLIGLSSAGCDYCYIAANKHDYDLTIKECTEQINTPHIFSSIQTRSYLNRGNAYAERGFLDLAIADYNKSVENNPAFVFAYYNRGLVFLRQNHDELAIADFTKAITLNANFIPAYYNRADAYRKDGRFDDALNDLDKVIGLNQKDEIAYSIRATVYAANKEFERALADHDKAIELNPKSTIVYGLRGGTYMNHGQYQQAENDFNIAIQLNPQNSSPYYNMACLFSLQKDVDKACTWLNKSITIGFNNWTLIRNDTDLSNIREASCYQQILTEHADNPPIISQVSGTDTLSESEPRFFKKGTTGAVFIFGRGKAFDNTYPIYGLRIGHFVEDGLEMGLSIVDWTGPSPRIVQISPDLRFVFYDIPYVKPYGGLFWRHSFIEGANDFDEVGVRAGINIPLNNRSYLGAGLVYQYALQCNGDCSSVNPEIMAAILF